MNALRRQGLPALLVLGLVLVYALATTHHVTEDSIKYVRDVLLGGPALFHPHHLLFGVMTLVPHVAGAGPADVDTSVRVLQWANILISALAVLSFYQVSRTLGCSPWMATTLALLFGLASAFFKFSSQVEVYNITSLFMCLSVLGLAQPTNRPHRRLLVGLGYFLAMGFHQIAVFLGIAILIDEWGRGSRRDRWSGLLRSLILPLVGIAVSYLVIGFALGYRTPLAIWDWLTLYSHLPFWGKGRLDAATLRELTVGVGKTLVDVTHLPKWILVAACLGLGTFVALHWSARPRVGLRRRLVVALLTWLAAYGLFQTWWHAGNVESWIVATVPAFGVLACLAGGEDAHRLSTARRAGAWGALGVCLVLVVVTDFLAVQRDRAPNSAREAALQLVPVARTGDLIFTADTATGAYFDLYLIGRGVAVEPINLEFAREAALQVGGRTLAQALVERMEAHVRAIQERHARCYVDAWVAAGDLQPVRYLKSLDPLEFQLLFAQSFAVQPITADGVAFIYEMTPR